MGQDRIDANSADQLTASVGLSSPLVGRAREKLTLVEALDTVLSGRGQIVAIAGEPGIGKTRLADEIAIIAAARGCIVCWGRCLEDGGAPAFWPWVQVLRRCVRECAGAAQLVGQNPNFARLLAETFSSTGGEIAYNRGSSLATPSAIRTDDIAIERFALFDATANFLKNCAGSKPLLILLDDLHAADEESILLLSFLLRDLRQTPIMVVATYRDSDVQRNPRIAQLLGSLNREGAPLLLQGLSTADVREFVELQTGAAPDLATIAELREITEGNPFFLTEVVRLLIAEGQLRGGRISTAHALRIPDGVRATVLRRVGTLSPVTQEIARVASIIGREFDWNLLRAIAEPDDSQLLAALEELVTLKLLARPSALPRFRFSHALVVESLQESVASPRRQQLHLRVAQEIRRLSPSMTAQIAHHYLLALPVGDADQAVLFTMRAADAAMDSLAYEQAVRLYRTVLEIIEVHRARYPRPHTEILLKLGEAECRVHDYQRSHQTFLSAAEIARQSGDQESFARAVIGYGMVGSDPGRTDLQLVALIKQALAMPGQRDLMRAMLLARLAEEIRWTAPANETARVIDEALAIARRDADPRTLIEALYIKFLTIRGPATAEQRLELSSEMLRIVEQHQLQDLAFNLRYHHASVLLELGDTSAFNHEILAINQMSEALRHQHLGFVEVIDSMRSLIEGRLAEATQRATEALEAGRRRPNSIAEQIFMVQMFLIRRESGTLAEVLPLLERVLSQHPENLPMRSILALAYAETGRSSLARAEFEILAANDFDALAPDFRWLISMAMVSETCSYLNDRQRASTLYRMLAPYASRSASVGLFGYAGSVSYYLAILATAMQRYDEAEAHFAQAIDCETRMIARVWGIRARYRFAAMLANRGGASDIARALDMLHDALPIAESLVLSDLIARCNELQTRLATAQTESAPPLGKLRPIAFRKEGDYWSIGSGAGLFRTRDSKGLGYIAQLLRQPGVEISSLDLLTSSGPPRQDDDESAAAIGKMGGERLADLNLRRGLPENAGQLLDPQAKAAYRSRLAELGEELKDARDSSDPHLAEHLEDEIDALQQELRRAVGLGGRDRLAGSAVERARLAVTRAIKSAIVKIAERDSELGGLLSQNVRTGTFCSFVISNRSDAVLWEF